MKPVVVARDSVEPAVSPGLLALAAIALALVLAGALVALALRHGATGLAALGGLAVQALLAAAVLARLGATVGVPGAAGLALGAVLSPIAFHYALRRSPWAASTLVEVAPLFAGVVAAAAGSGWLAAFGVGLASAAGAGLLALWLLVDPLAAVALSGAGPSATSSPASP